MENTLLVLLLLAGVIAFTYGASVGFRGKALYLDYYGEEVSDRVKADPLLRAEAGQSIQGVVPCRRNAACGADSLDLLGLPSRQKRLGVDRFGCLRLSGCDRRGLSAREDQEPVMGLVVCRINVTVVL